MGLYGAPSGMCNKSIDLLVWSQISLNNNFIISNTFENLVKLNMNLLLIYFYNNFDLIISRKNSVRYEVADKMVETLNKEMG